MFIKNKHFDALSIHHTIHIKKSFKENNDGSFYSLKVTIFQECQPEFLHDLVLKMRAYIFTPGDIICRKGEVAREMFIIADGVLEVVK